MYAIFAFPRSAATILAAAALAACGGGEQRADTAAGADSARTASAPPSKQRDISGGLKTPEAARYDADLDVWFISNINGNPSAKDNNGFITRARPDGAIDSLMFVAGGRGGVTLNAPKGMAIEGDTLWVADIDAVRAFNKRTGAPIASVSFAGQRANFLNDVAIGPDGNVYVTDTGIRFSATGEMSAPGPDRVFSIGARNAITVVAEGDSLGHPNGITYDRAGDRWVIVPFNARSILSLKAGEKMPTAIGTGPGQFDGVEVLGDGRILVSSWADSAVYAFRDGQATKVITGVPAPADIGYDAQRGVVAIPLFNSDRVELWSMR
ncbi:MAG TPA: SMP-30/gluconolactonase/LRE family protein [Gemmatimonadaceae bacterium]|nr:SMP-30/gluconolactonase/LRE family protein [Gemmatimonadaceae bacterium]